MTSPPSAPGHHPTNLPPRLPSLVGRQEDLATLTELLSSPQTSVITLMGPGGTGKTSLAGALGQKLLSSFSDGVFFVDLSALIDHALVIPVIAQTLALKETPGRTLTQILGDYLASKDMLLSSTTSSRSSPPQQRCRPPHQSTRPQGHGHLPRGAAHPKRADLLPRSPRASLPDYHDLAEVDGGPSPWSSPISRDPRTCSRSSAPALRPCSRISASSCAPPSHLTQESRSTPREMPCSMRSLVPRTRSVERSKPSGRFPPMTSEREWKLGVRMGIHTGEADCFR
jgi:hypothetical protein